MPLKANPCFWLAKSSCALHCTHPRAYPRLCDTAEAGCCYPQLTDDEDAIQEEEDEAVRLQREAAKSLQPGDFGDEEDSEEGDSDAASDEEEAEEMTMERQAKEVGVVVDAGTI
jgi:hypothetical protein